MGNNNHAYRPAIIETFFDYFVTGEYTVKEIAKLCGIAVGTVYTWKEKHPDFKKRWEEAEQKQKDNIHQIAQKAMVQLLQGKEYTETYEEFEIQKPPPKASRWLQDEVDDLLEGTGAHTEPKEEEKEKLVLKRKTVTKKYIQPTPAIVMFVKRNLDPANYPESSKKITPAVDQPGTPVPVVLTIPEGININFPTNFSEHDPTGDKNSGGLQADSTSSEQPTPAE